MILASKRFNFRHFNFFSPQPLAQLQFPATGNDPTAKYYLDKLESHFFCLPEKKLPRKRQPTLRQLLDLSKKASGLPLEFSRKTSVSSSFPFAFLPVQIHQLRKGIVLKTPIKSGLRLVSVKKLSFLSRPKGEFFTSDPPAGGEFEKLGEKSEILAGGSWPAVWLMRLLPKVEKYLDKMIYNDLLLN